MNIENFLILPILKNICKWLFFYFFNGSRLHGPKGLRSRLYHSVRLQSRNRRSIVFGFKSAPLALEQVPTCIQKPRKIPLISQLSFDIDCFLVVLDGFRSFLDPLGCFRSFKLVSHFSKYHKICSSSC